MAPKTGRYEMRIDPEKLALYREAAREAGLSLPEWLETAADEKLSREGAARDPREEGK